MKRCAERGRTGPPGAAPLNLDPLIASQNNQTDNNNKKKLRKTDHNLKKKGATESTSTTSIAPRKDGDTEKGPFPGVPRRSTMDRYPESGPNGL